MFLELLANPNAFGSTGPSPGGFAFGAPSAPSSTGFNFAGAAQANTGQGSFAFGAGAGGAPTFGASTAPTGGGEFLEIFLSPFFFCLLCIDICKSD